jgi:hypothetical protein
MATSIIAAAQETNEGVLDRASRESSNEARTTARVRGDTSDGGLRSGALVARLRAAAEKAWWRDMAGLVGERLSNFRSKLAWFEHPDAYSYYQR